MEKQQFKYFAFISYNQKDYGWGKKLQRKLEGYKMPSTLCSQHGWAKQPIKPVFFAPTDIQPGELSEELQQRLRSSRNLIVICSPDSAKSVWVGREIEYFHSLGRAKNIYFFIVDGAPFDANPKRRCYNPIVEKLGLSDVLGVNVNEKVSKWPWVNRERAYIQLITKLLGIEFDSLWKRHKRLMIQRIITFVFMFILVLSALTYTWIHNKPTEVEVRLKEITPHNENLPQIEDAVVSMTLNNETKNDTVHSLSDRAVFVNIPKKMLGQKIRIHLSCGEYYHDVDTTLVLQKSMMVNVSRKKDLYGHLRFRIYDESSSVSGVKVTIEGYSAISDKDGYIDIQIPIEKQKKEYNVKSSVHLQGVLSMPLTESSIMVVEK